VCVCVCVCVKIPVNYVCFLAFGGIMSSATKQQCLLRFAGRSCVDGMLRSIFHQSFPSDFTR